MVRLGDLEIEKTSYAPPESQKVENACMYAYAALEEERRGTL